MEEQIGIWWHRLVTRLAEDRTTPARVSLSDMRREPGILFRAFGGAHGLKLSPAPLGRTKRTRFVQRLAGTGGRLPLATFNAQSLCLPEYVDVYATPALHRDLYRWWAMLAGQLPGLQGNGLVACQHGTRTLIARYPGIDFLYRRLVQAEIARRGPLDRLPDAGQPVERALRQALLNPGSVATLPPGRLPQPVLLWPIQADQPTPDATTGDEEPDADPVQPVVGQDDKRRQAQRSEQTARSGGLFLPRPESIFSWTEYINVEHPIEENEEDDLARAADDLEVLHLNRSAQRVSRKLRMNLETGERAGTATPAPPALHLPEWNFRTNMLQPDHCSVRILPHAPAALGCDLPERLRTSHRKLLARLSALLPENQTLRGQADGSSIDLDACIRARTGEHRQSEFMYLNPRRKERDLSCLLLADFSLSTEAALDQQTRVLDVLRDSLLLFAETLSTTRDRVAILGFNSRGRHQVRISEIKPFGERYGSATRQRILDMQPAYYTRMGAAVRYASLMLGKERTRKRLLILLTDGKPNDNDHYEGRYGVEDTRKALSECRRQGLLPFCVTIDQEGETYLPYIFGQQGFVIVKNPRELPQRLTRLYVQLTRSMH